MFEIESARITAAGVSFQLPPALSFWRPRSPMSTAPWSFVPRTAATKSSSAWIAVFTPPAMNSAVFCPRAATAFSGPLRPSDRTAFPGTPPLISAASRAIGSCGWIYRMQMIRTWRLIRWCFSWLPIGAGALRLTVTVLR